MQPPNTTPSKANPYAWSAEDPGTPPSVPAPAPTEFFPARYSPPPATSASAPNTHLASAGLPTSNDAAPPVYRFGDPSDDRPLLQELGIFPANIRAKAYSVLNPFGRQSACVTEDTDLAGPLVFALALGGMLSLQGKLHFEAIYGISVLGIVLAKVLLTLMTEKGGVELQFVISTLGYCLLPNIVLGCVQAVQYWLLGSHHVMLPFAVFAVLWSAWCASAMFVHALGMEHQRYLVLYPCALLYVAFAAITVF